MTFCNTNIKIVGGKVFLANNGNVTAAAFSDIMNSNKKKKNL
jgi:hypothetical protein